MQGNSACVHYSGVSSLRRALTTLMHYAENECGMPIWLHCNELRALCLTTNALCRTAEISALLLKCALIVYIWPEKGVQFGGCTRGQFLYFRVLSSQAILNQTIVSVDQQTAKTIVNRLANRINRLHLFSLRIGICSAQIGRLHWCRHLGYHSDKGRLISTLCTYVRQGALKIDTVHLVDTGHII